MRYKEKEKKIGCTGHPFILINFTQTDMISINGFNCILQVILQVFWSWVPSALLHVLSFGTSGGVMIIVEKGSHFLTGWLIFFPVWLLFFIRPMFILSFEMLLRKPIIVASSLFQVIKNKSCGIDREGKQFNLMIYLFLRKWLAGEATHQLLDPASCLSNTHSQNISGLSEHDLTRSVSSSTASVLLSMPMECAALAKVEFLKISLQILIVCYQRWLLPFYPHGNPGAVRSVFHLPKKQVFKIYASTGSVPFF